MSQHSPFLITSSPDKTGSFSSSQQLVVAAEVVAFFGEQQSSIIAKETFPFPLFKQTIELMVKPKLEKRKIAAKNTAAIF